MSARYDLWAGKNAASAEQQPEKPIQPEAIEMPDDEEGKNIIANRIVVDFGKCLRD